MLAASLVGKKVFERGSIAVLALVDDHHAQAAVEALQKEMLEPDFARFVALEDLIRAAWDMPEFGGWAAKFHRRYLDLTPVLDNRSL